MGFFDDVDSNAAPALVPLSEELVNAALDGMEIVHKHDDDGEHIAVYENSYYSFNIVGRQNEILSIRGNWRGYLPESDRGDLVVLLEDHHRETLWPKVYTQFIDEVGVIVRSEVNIDWEHGVTLEQVQQQIRCAVGTSHEVFEKIEERFGRPWEKEEAEA